MRPHGFPSADFLQRVLVDSPAHEFPLGNLRDSRQLFIGRNRVSFSLVFNRFEIQQTQIFALFPMLVGLFADVDRAASSQRCAPVATILAYRTRTVFRPVQGSWLRDGSGTTPRA